MSSKCCQILMGMRSFTWSQWACNSMHATISNQTRLLYAQWLFTPYWTPPTQWFFTPHCSVQMSPFLLYVLGNLTEKINIYDKGGMGWRVQVFVLPVFFSKVTVKWILKRGLKQASNPKVWFVVHWPRILSCSVWLHRKSCLKINIHYTVYM